MTQIFVLQSIINVADERYFMETFHTLFQRLKKREVFCWFDRVSQLT